MRKSVAAGVLAAGMFLGGCAAQTPPETTTTSPAPEPTVSAPESTPTASAAEVPQECVDYVAPPSPGSEAMQAVGATAVLPDGVVLNPGFQVLNSIDEPGKVEAVARVCSDGLTDDELVDVGEAIAATLYAHPIHETLTLLKVSSWVPTGDHLDRDPGVDVITTDYELYLWDDPRPSNWTR
ncbi:hypothetical protein [Microbacterium paraoxydans]|jgi:hypothetical protein|uniref:Uncharacterized protein n=1 Tax=Microbacterium paraoxydans TaxID=199592 RepID=A0A1H1L8X2_9MICO|nr:hypothetical protein [Microbacterium paraoxydans]SDR70505.1 hypothetical protein SAMN04489809_0011 [Microbacterium paraoxydans]SDR72436.1 hypothetical protein SAMN04489809_0087 [Microbacterium paraoxydans]